MKYDRRVEEIVQKTIDESFAIGVDYGFNNALQMMLNLSDSDFMEMTTPKDVIEHIVRLARGIKKNTFKPVVKL